MAYIRRDGIELLRNEAAMREDTSFRPLSETARDTTEPLIVLCGAQLKTRRFAPSFESIQAPTS